MDSGYDKYMDYSQVLCDLQWGEDHVSATLGTDGGTLI